MADTITDVATTVTSAADMIAEARNDTKVHIGYIAGVHEDGSKCSACVRFDAANIATMNAHSGTSEVVRIELPLTHEAFGAFAQSMGGSLGPDGLTIGGQTFPASTPTLFAYTVDSQGQVRINSVLTAGANFDNWLTGVEAANRSVAANNALPENPRLESAMQLAQAQALAALRDGKPTGSTVPNYNAGPEAVQRG